LQTVLPTFGVGAEAMRGPKAAADGLGRYAFAPSAHMTEAHALNSAASSRQLLSEWGAYWNLSKPVLLEKTPTDMLTSRLLQALLTPQGAPRGTFNTRHFLFVTRHPIAVALAHKRWQARAATPARASGPAPAASTAVPLQPCAHKTTTSPN
jgi:hypothetical protein